MYVRKKKLETGADVKCLRMADETDKIGLLRNHMDLVCKNHIIHET